MMQNLQPKSIRRNGVHYHNSVAYFMRRQGAHRLIWLLSLCFGLSFFIYLLTLAPTVYTFDSAEFVTGAYSLGIIHATGYPFYLLLAKLFTLLPIGDVAYRVNLMSALWGAVAVSLLYLILLKLTHRIWISALTALLYAFSHYFWPAAVVAETYTLNATLIALFILLALSWRNRPNPNNIALTGFILGLSLANHMSTVLVIPALFYWGLINRAKLDPLPRSVLLFGISTGIGLLFYLYLPIRYAADPPLNYAKAYFAVDLTSPSGLWSWISAEMFRPFILGYDFFSIWSESLSYLTWLFSNFIGAGVVIGIIGLIHMLRKDARLFFFFVLIYLTYTLFFINYRVVNKDTMFNISYLIWAVWIAYGGKAIDEWLVSVRISKSHSLAGLARSILPAILGLLVILSFITNYAWADQSHNYMASDLAQSMLDEVQPRAFIVTEWTLATPLEYYQIVGNRRPDVTIFDRGLYGLSILNRLRKQRIQDSVAFDQIEREVTRLIQVTIEQRPVYATQYDSSLEEEFYFIPQNYYYRLEPRP